MSCPLFHDALGREVRLPEPPRRIVSLVPSQTELLADLGLDDEVVGLTRFCVHPADWKARKTIVGGTKNVNLDRAAALQPDLVLANKEENVREDVNALAEIAPVYVTDVSTVTDALAMIRDVGALVGRTDRALELADSIEVGFNHLNPTRRQRAAYLIWRDPWMTVGGDTFISDVMAHAGLDNVYARDTRYPTVTPKDLRSRQPDVILLSSEPFPFREPHLDEVRALVPDADIALVDGEVFSWHGSRMRHAPASLRRMRELTSPPLP
ncbi:MAG: helical backbone metal receptor [Rubricoccaceae bacterium]